MSHQSLIQTHNPLRDTYCQFLQHTTWVWVVVFGNVQLIGESANILMSHCQPPGCLFQVSLKPLALISLPGNLLTVGLMLKNKVWMVRVGRV